MKENKISIVINKSVGEVFEFTINPRNTPLWISSVKEEVADEFPPKVGTRYKNRGSGDWDFYKVVEFDKNRVFTLSDLDGNYRVRYTYRALGEDKTELTYFEWVESGELKNPFTLSVLEKLKFVLES